MNRKEKPQISPNLFKRLLEFDNIEKGTRIYKPLDQTITHWQHKTYIITGIDNAKEVLLVTDSNDKPEAIPFSELHDYWVLINHVDSKYAHVKKTRKRKRYVEQD